MRNPKISVVIGTFNRLQLLQLCIRAVREELHDISHEIIVVDGGSDDQTIDWITKQKDIVSIVQHNRGDWLGQPIKRKPWAYFMGLGFRCATGDLVCMLSDDSLILPNAILNGIKTFEEEQRNNRKIGAVCFYFRDYPVRKKYAVAKNVGNLYVNHGLYLNSALREVGYIDTDYHFYFADTDLVLKMKQAGYECIASENSFVEHYFEATPEIRSTNNDYRKNEDRNRLINKWCGIAYPEEDKNKYLSNIGYWVCHQKGFTDQYNFIKKLILASHDELSIYSPLISIVVVVKNNKDGLLRTLSSIRSEIYPLKDVVVIDGGSTDGTIDVINKFYDFIDSYVSEEDTGTYEAMNKGINLAKGDYVLFLNSGDEFYSQKSVYDAVVSNEDFVNFDVIYGSHNYIKNGVKELRVSNKVSSIIAKMPFNHQSAFYKRDILIKHSYDTSLKYCGDYEQLVRLFKDKAKFLQITNIISNFYSGGVSESSEGPLKEIVAVQIRIFGNKRVSEHSVYYKKMMEKALSNDHPIK